MNILYRKVLCSERLPCLYGHYDTDLGRVYFRSDEKWMYGLRIIYPSYWFEEVTIPTDEEIEKMADSFANKKWDKYCDGNNTSSSDKEQDIYDKIIGISHTEYDYEIGFRIALELLTGGK